MEQPEFTISVAIHVHADGNIMNGQAAERPRQVLALQQIITATLARECDFAHKLERALLDAQWGDSRVHIEVGTGR